MEENRLENIKSMGVSRMTCPWRYATVNIYYQGTPNIIMNVNTNNRRTAFIGHYL